MWAGAPPRPQRKDSANGNSPAVVACAYGSDPHDMDAASFHSRHEVPFGVGVGRATQTRPMTNASVNRRPTPACPCWAALQADRQSAFTAREKQWRRTRRVRRRRDRGVGVGGGTPPPTKKDSANGNSPAVVACAYGSDPHDMDAASFHSRHEVPFGVGVGRATQTRPMTNASVNRRPTPTPTSARCRSRDLNPDTRKEYCALNAARLPFRHFGPRSARV